MQTLDRVSLSLVSVRDLDLKSLRSLVELGTFSSFALAPSHFMSLEKENSLGDLTRRSKELKRIVGEIHSVQGIFYGLGEPTLHSLRERAKEVSAVCEMLECSMLVVGAPALRSPDDLWRKVLESLTDCVNSSIEISVENICSGRCNEREDHPWLIEPFERISIAVDIANSLECESLVPERLVASKNSRVLHLSGRGHSSECSTLTANLARIALEKLEGHEAVIEIGGSSIHEIFSNSTRFLEKLRRAFDP